LKENSSLSRKKNLQDFYFAISSFWEGGRRNAFMQIKVVSPKIYPAPPFSLKSLFSLLDFLGKKWRIVELHRYFNFMREKTLFEKIIDRTIPAQVEFEDELCIVVRDIRPQAPIHLLIIPKKVIARVGMAEDADQALLGHLLLVAKKVAQKLKIEDGFRLVINNGAIAGETVPHMHVHLLAGRPLSWPPG